MATLIASENWDSYSNGNDITGLSGGTGWAAAWINGGGTAIVTNAQAQSGTLSALLSTSADRERTISSGTTTILSGTMYFYVTATLAATEQQRVSFRNSNSQNLHVGIGQVNGGAGLVTNANIQIGWTGGNLSLGAYTTGTWNKIDFIQTSNLTSGRLNNGTWFTLATTPSSTVWNHLALQNSVTSTTVYFDSLDIYDYNNFSTVTDNALATFGGI